MGEIFTVKQQISESEREIRFSSLFYEYGYEHVVLFLLHYIELN
jgi:hypothetical protein